MEGRNGNEGNGGRKERVWKRGGMHRKGKAMEKRGGDKGQRTKGRASATEKSATDYKIRVGSPVSVVIWHKPHH